MNSGRDFSKVMATNLLMSGRDHLIVVNVMKTGFGWIEVKGTRYEHDIIIHTGGTISKRKKRPSKAYKGSYGHTPLSAEELGFLGEEKPEVVYIGTGQYGDLPLTAEAEALLKQYPATIKPTPEILEDIDRETRPYTGVLHVTC